MAFTGCSRDLDFNPTTTILKHLMKGEKMTTYEEELKEHINILKQQLNHKGEVVWVITPQDLVVNTTYIPKCQQK